MVEVISCGNGMIAVPGGVANGVGVISEPDIVGCGSNGGSVHGVVDNVVDAPDATTGVVAAPDMASMVDAPDVMAGVVAAPDAMAGVAATPDVTTVVVDAPHVMAGVVAVPDVITGVVDVPDVMAGVVDAATAPGIMACELGEVDTIMAMVPCWAES